MVEEEMKVTKEEVVKEAVVGVKEGTTKDETFLLYVIKRITTRYYYSHGSFHP